MFIEIGQVEAIFRYPVKSMGGEPLEPPNWAGTAPSAAEARFFGWVTCTAAQAAEKTRFEVRQGLKPLPIS